MKKKRIIVIIVIILLTILLVGGIILFVKHLNKVSDEKIKDAAYKMCYETNICDKTSVRELINNGYLSDDFDSDECKIITYNNDNDLISTNILNKDCDYKNEKRLIVSFKNSSDEYTLINNYIHEEGILSFKVSNDNSYKFVGIYDEFDDLITDENSYKITKETKEKLIRIKFNNGEDLFFDYLIKSYLVKPSIKSSRIDSNIANAEYVSDLDVVAYYAFVTDGDFTPTKGLFTDNPVLESYDCNKTYYVWSYGMDEAGNISEISKIGEILKKCEDGIGNGGGN